MADGCLDAALRYAARGWKVLPCHSIIDGKCSCGYQCSSPGKHPITATGLTEATTDEARIKWWFAKHPRANVAVATGNGLAVVDVDAKSGGWESLAELTIPNTPSVTTGGGGIHYYLSGDVGSTVGIRQGIDIRGRGGYVLAPPSNHQSGQQYEWDSVTEELPLAPYPADLVRQAPTLADGDDPSIGEGSRNATLASLAGTMRRKGFSKDALLAALLAENQARCQPPLEDREVENIARSVARYQPEPTAQVEIIARSAPSFLAMKVATPRYLINGVWPEHAIGFIAGPPKSFKSFLALNMAFAMSTAKPFLGKFEVPAPRTVLLIDHESSRGALSERVRRCELRYGDARTLYLISNKAFSLEDPGDVERLRLEISAVRPDLTVLDPLASFTRGDENSAQQMGVVVRLLRSMRDEFGTGFAIVHHTNKAREGDTTRGGERMRGSGAFYAAAEVGIWVKRVDSEEARSNIRVEMKDGEGPLPFQVAFDPDLADLRYIEPFAEAFETMTRRPTMVPPKQLTMEAPYYARD